MSLERQVRTTVSLPAKSLAAAKRAAKQRNVNLGTVMGEALDELMKQQQRRERAEEIMARYQRAFGRFSDEDMMVLDGIILEPKNSSKGKR
jgi:predicted nucleic acid-binding protein